MNAFVQLPPAERRQVFEEVARRHGPTATLIEKDYWVCKTLRALFGLPTIGGQLTFKGGTSLSKCWGVIQRFSEDIDLVYDMDALGFGGANAPSKARSLTKRREGVERLQAATRTWLDVDLRPLLMHALNSDDEPVTITPDARKAETLLVRYSTLFETTAANYVQPIVRIELMARGEPHPTGKRRVRSWVNEHFPQLDRSGDFEVRAILPTRTFWEKICLLHEKLNGVAKGKPLGDRMARHYYDVWALIAAGYADQAIRDQSLLRSVVAHRRVYFPVAGMDYDDLWPGAFKIVPPKSEQAYWRADYENMRVALILGDPPTFDEILSSVEGFQKSLNAIDWRR